jgi:ABC-type glycerol-3-phosphate transport system substrate-binding protein
LFLKFVTNQENTARWSMITGNIPVRYRAIESQVYQDFLNHPTEEQKYYSLVANVNVKQLDDLFFPVAFKKAIFYYNDVNLAAEHIVIDGWSVSMALKWIEED